jgi:type II secretory pathway component GspD/PulD (secretin)
MLKKFLIGLLVASQTACAFPRSAPSPEVRSAEKAKVPEKDQLLSRADDPAILDVPISDTVFVPQSMERSDPLPSLRIENFNAYEMRASDALRLLLQDKKIPVVFESATNDIVVSAIGLSGTLEEVLDKMSKMGGLYYTYQDGVLRVKATRRFVVSLPPVQQNTGGQEISGLLDKMGAEETSTDNSNHVVFFTAKRDVYEEVRTYLQKIRDTKSLLVYESYFFEVTLNDDKALGINFNKANEKFANLGLKFSGGSTVGAVGTSNPFSLGSTYTAGDLDVDILTKFLQTQGSVETLSKPTISIIAGTSASFRVGNKLRYISQTQTTAATTTGTTTTTANPTVTVTTDTLDLGLTLALTGDFEEDSVYTTVRLDITNLTSLDEFSSGSGDNATTLKLPQTNDRSLTTAVRVRPGDSILIAGIQNSQDTTNTNGTPAFRGFSLQTLKSDSVKRSELVVVMRPRVIRFVPRSKLGMDAAASDSFAKTASLPLGLVGRTLPEAVAGGGVEPSKSMGWPVQAGAQADALPPIRNSLDGVVGVVKRVGN